VQKGAFDNAYTLTSFGLTRSIKLVHVRHRPRCSPPAPFPWVAGKSTMSKAKFWEIQEIFLVMTNKGWLRLVGSLELQFYFAEYSRFWWGSFAKETCNFKEPTNRSHPIAALPLTLETRKEHGGGGGWQRNILGFYFPLNNRFLGCGMTQVSWGVKRPCTQDSNSRHRSLLSFVSYSRISGGDDKLRRRCDIRNNICLRLTQTATG